MVRKSLLVCLILLLTSLSYAATSYVKRYNPETGRGDWVLNPATLTNADLPLVVSGSGNPGGSTKQIQYNSSGSFAGSPKMSFNSTDNSIYFGGNLGIGSVSPTQALDVVGTAKATAFSGPLTGNVTGTASSATALAANGTNCTGQAATGVDASGNAEGCFTVVTSESDPVAKAINGILKSNGSTLSAAAAGTDYVAPGGAGTISGLTAARIPVANSSTTIIDSNIYTNGTNVGIGVTNPGGRLVVSGDIYNMNGNIGIGTWTTLAGLTIGSGGTKTYVVDSSGAHIKGNLEVDGSLYATLSFSSLSANSVPKNSSGSLVDSTVYVSSGNLGIGTSSPAALLDVIGGTSSSVNVGSIVGTTSGCDANTGLYLRMEGSNGGTTFTDSNCDGSGAKTVTVSSTVTTSTEAAKFGNTSAKNLATGSLTLADNAAWTWAGDVTLDAWVNFSTLPSAASYETIFGSTTCSVLANCIYAGVSNASGTYKMFIGNLNVDNASVAGAVTVSTGQWHHYEFVRTSGVWKTFFDGTQVGSNWSDSVSYDLAGFQIGQYGASTATRVNGYVDELRVSPGLARHTGNFTAPTQYYGAPANAFPAAVFKVNGTPTWAITSQGADSSLSIGLSTSTSDTKVSILSGGNVGIGTVNPEFPLAIRVSGKALMSKKTGANTACTTTCGTASCYFGEDTGVLGTLLDCADATADVCFCAGN